MIYDLASVIELEKRENVATEELEVITFCHKICKVFYDQEGSPLYRQIRMLGTGQGSVSQGFLVDALYLIVVKLRQEYNEQEIFNALYYYLSSFQSIFSDDWLYFAIEKCREMQCFLHRFASPYISYKLVFDKAFFSR